MNRVILMGRLTRDPMVTYSNTQSGEQMCIARFTVACDRRVRRDANSAEQTADFISCVSFGKTAEFISKYFKQGMRISLDGRITTGSYTNKEGQKVYTTEVTVENAEFCESKNASGGMTAPTGFMQPAGGRPSPSQAAADGFMQIADSVEDEGLPFN